MNKLLFGSKLIASVQCLLQQIRIHLLLSALYVVTLLKEYNRKLQQRGKRKKMRCIAYTFEVKCEGDFLYTCKLQI